ncbi:alanyl-tRNA synthetase [Roseivirga pacifica]|uniref:Alanine--tRNA ligase n=1 Tax=Roseivirga pacifica TaxID=1267423 RepID=A0A1I0QP62_9BACT|nr:alanine--tRNA ligase [Roseivirga pacifica]RKQ42738.1 alanyl-tRNA synthetase [Roseivirga pacifica]SEW29087.1 alanyl-tRNA synthetase [Roseivirga pacifica]
MQSKEIRSKFIEFFESRGHKYVPSAPMVLKNDPTLMFTNAGMNQFKDLFLGNKKEDYTRAVNSQKCLRVSGKHNDLEEVGIDTYHHTMFEMLGNWSFGDYFKQEAIGWSWELLTEVFGLPKERLYVTVFEGDKTDGVPFDKEAFDFWKSHIDEARILNGDKKDNFWEMGDTGPCGPCSEVHIDLRSDEEIAQKPGKDLVNMDHPQVVEIWNLVFIQFDRKADGSLENLPAKHIDTGMGFERLCMAMQGKLSNYDTDVFTPLIEKIAKKAGVNYKDKEETDIAIRVIVDHIRAISFAIADGQLPSNNKAGYVVRRILRRAVRYGYTFLNFQEPFLYELVDVLADQYEGFFDELSGQKDFIAKVVREEENSFLRTLENGLKRLDQIESKLTKEGKKEIEGKEVFELYDTFGFPVDLTALIAREKGLAVDEAGFQSAMAEQKNRSKADAASEKGDWIQVGDDEQVEFVGYDATEAQAEIIKYREIKDKKGKVFQIVLNKTPFYGESGGQIGDTGVLVGDGETINVLDTQKENDLIVHFTNKLPSKPEANFTAKINAERRALIKNNHSSTHLLHSALREVLGDHVQQKGSLVSDQLLRFDFSHFQKVTDEEIERIEQIVNEHVRQNIKLDERRNVPIEDAKALGATALFGEKYGEFVRVITFDPKYSVELCGGTHVNATGDIGLFKIVSEGAVAAGVRRIEAYTGPGAFNYVQEQEKALKSVKDLLKNPKDLSKAIEGLLEEQKKLSKEIEGLHAKQSGQVKTDLIAKAEDKAGIKVIAQQVTLPSADALKKLSFELKNEVENVFAVLAADIAGKPQIAVVIDEALVKDKGLNAGQIIRDLAKEIKGGGGGQPFFATAGGKDLSGLPKVIEKTTELVATFE